MSGSRLDSMLLASREPERLGRWYAEVFRPDQDEEVDGYRVLGLGEFHLLVDHRVELEAENPDPARVILNFDVDDAREVVDRLETAGTTWISRLEDRDGSLFATATDPDGNYVQVIQLSEEHRKAMG